MAFVGFLSSIGLGLLNYRCLFISVYCHLLQSSHLCLLKTLPASSNHLSLGFPILLLPSSLLTYTFMTALPCYVFLLTLYSSLLNVCYNFQIFIHSMKFLTAYYSHCSLFNHRLNMIFKIFFSHMYSFLQCRALSLAVFHSCLQQLISIMFLYIWG